MIAKQKYAHLCIRHTVPESSFHFIFAFLPNFRQSQPESRLSVPAFTNRSKVGRKSGSAISRQTTLAVSLSIFISLLQENPPIFRSPEFRKFPKKKIQIYGGHTEQIGFTEFRKFTENWHPCTSGGKNTQFRGWSISMMLFWWVYT